MSGWDESLLNAYLDGELDGDQAREVERLLASDPDARRELARLSYVVGLVRASARRGLTPPPPSMVEAIARHGESLMSRRQAIGWALAASLGAIALGGGGAYLGYRRAREDADADTTQLAATSELDGWLTGVADYIRLYANDQRHLVEVAADRKTYIETWLGERLERPLRVPDLSQQNLTFRGARLLSVNGRPVAQLVYLEPSGRPVGICVTRTARTDQSPTIARRDDINLLHWNRAGSAYVVVGWDDDATLQTIWAAARMQLAMQ
jgi:anti-sigma factor RsiW